MLASLDLEGKEVIITIASFAASSKTEYRGVVEKMLYFGSNGLMIKLDNGNIINTNYISSIEIVA